MYARRKNTQLNIGWKVHPKYGLGCTINVRMVTWWTKELEWNSTIHFKAIGLLEVLNSHIIVQLSVFRLETTRVLRKNGEGEKYHYTKNN